MKRRSSARIGVNSRDTDHRGDVGDNRLLITDPTQGLLSPRTHHEAMPGWCCWSIASKASKSRQNRMCDGAIRRHSNLVSRGPELRDQSSHVRVSGQLMYESHRIDIDGTQLSTHVPLCCSIHEVKAPVTGPTDDAWWGEWLRRRSLCAPRCRCRSLRPGVRCTPCARSGWSRLRQPAYTLAWSGSDVNPRCVARAT